MTSLTFSSRSESYAAAERTGILSNRGWRPRGGTGTIDLRGGTTEGAPLSGNTLLYMPLTRSSSQVLARSKRSRVKCGVIGQVEAKPVMRVFVIRLQRE